MNRHPLLSIPLALALALGAPTAAFAAPQAATVAVALPGTVVQTPAGPVRELVLKNGMKVLLKEDRAAPVVTWAVTYKVGSRNEPTGATGSAHLLEHMLFKGTKTLGKGQVAQLLNRNGADFNAFTSADVTAYYETYSSDRLELGLMVEASRMRDALILDAERQSEMTVVRNEMERGESSPSSVLWHEVGATAFKAHPYHHPVIGWRSDVENVPTSQLKKFYDTYYQPNNAVAVLVGDFDSAEAIRLIKKHFEAFPHGPKVPEVHTVEEPQLGERRVTLRRRGETNMVQLAHHTPAARHQDIAPLMVLDSILSNGVTSRLYQAMVETQIATSAWSDVRVQRDPSLFRLHATIKPGVKHEVAEQALIAEVEKVKTTPVSASELKKAKNQTEAGYVYQNEGTKGLAFALLNYEGTGDWRRAFSLLEEVRAVTAADIQRVAKAYLTQDNRTTGWYVATPDGPVPPQPVSVGGGKAAANTGKVTPPALFPFEKQGFARRQLTPPTRRVLKNGLTVLVLENPGSQTVAIDGYVRAGGLLDPKQKQGLADTVAALLDAGTKKRTKLQLANDLEFEAASVGFSGGQATTSVSGTALAEDLDLALTALAEMLEEPAFPQAELDKLKSRWIASIKQAEDQPGTHAARALSQAIYPEGHPFRQLDAAEAIRQIESIGVEDLKAFHRRYYGPNNTTLVVVGKVEAERVIGQLERLFADWKPAERVAVAIPDVQPGPASRVVLPMMDKTNVEILFGHAGTIKRTSPGYYASALANNIIGGGTLTSRLGVKLRDEMGLTYGTY
ncbi:MAG: M16 family metallopeptidase, partial [Candidatus Sericytochromatia bacterium]